MSAGVDDGWPKAFKSAGNTTQFQDRTAIAMIDRVHRIPERGLDSTLGHIVVR